MWATANCATSDHIPLDTPSALSPLTAGHAIARIAELAATYTDDTLTFLTALCDPAPPGSTLAELATVAATLHTPPV